MSFSENFNYYWIERAGQRMPKMPIIADPYYTLLIIFVYVYFVYSLGPRFMKNRESYELKTFIRLYNLVQIVSNAWLVYDQIDMGLFRMPLICPNTLDYSEESVAIRAKWNMWFYYILKILDCVETGVFILRKKNSQVTLLHIYHHVSTLLISWFITRYYNIAPGLLCMMINSSVHTIMYIYYIVSSCGPNVQKAIAPIKRWLTIMQMTQFVVLGFYNAHNFIPACNRVPNSLVIIYILNLIINFNMFYNFYKNTYVKSKRKIN